MRDMVYVQWPEFHYFTWFADNPESFYTMFQLNYGYWEAICLRMVRLFGEPLVCQRQPTLRHYGANERPPYRRHDDSEFGHPRPLYNLWIPLTNVPEGVLVTDHQESRAILGGAEAIVFESSSAHEVRTVGVERVSMDARFIPEALYRECGPGAVTANTKTPIRLGDYYFRSDDLEVRNVQAAY